MRGDIYQQLARIETVTQQFRGAVVLKVAEAINDAIRTARTARLCPDCGNVMVRDGTMYRCRCGLCRDDSDTPTAEFSPVHPS